MGRYGLKYNSNTAVDVTGTKNVIAEISGHKKSLVSVSLAVKETILN